MKASGDHEPSVFASALHHIDTQRLAIRTKRYAFAIRRKRRLGFLRWRIRRQTRCVFAAYTLFEQVPVPVFLSSINKTFPVGCECWKEFGSRLVCQLQMDRA